MPLVMGNISQLRASKPILIASIEIKSRGGKGEDLSHRLDQDRPRMQGMDLKYQLKSKMEPIHQAPSMPKEDSGNVINMIPRN